MFPNLSHNSAKQVAKKQFKITAEANGNNAVIRIDGFIGGWNNCATDFKSKLDALITSGIKDATVYINSEGGNVFEADEISNEIQRFSGTTTARLGAKCMSAATKIACDCDKVIAAKNTSFMIHKPSGVIEGNVDEVNATLKLLQNKTNEYAAAYAAKTGLPVSKIEDMWIEDCHMNAEEAKAKGFVNEIEGEAEITEEDVEALSEMGITITATAKPQNQNLNNNEMKREFLIMALALDANVTDAQITAALTNLTAKAAKADSLQAELNTLKTSAIDEKAEMKATAAVEAKKITAAEKAFWKKNLIAEFEATATILDAKPVLTALSATITPAGDGSAPAEDRSKWTYNDWQEKDHKGLMAMAGTDEPKFKALYTAQFGKEAAEMVFK